MALIKKYAGIKILLICTLLYITVLPAMAQSAKQSDFSGTWLLDTVASKFNGVPAATAASVELGFSQHETYLALTKLAKGVDGQVFSFRDTLSYDGKPSVRIIPNTGTNVYTKTTTVKRSVDGKLVLSANYKVSSPDGNEFFYSTNETYSLSAGNNTLTLERTSILPDRTERVTAIYHKKQ